jgi:O-antigen/teichoic acid export membrane protein
MRQSTLLAVNTLAVYLRMALTVPMGILLVRYAYGGLGEVDFGLWSAIGASTALIAVVTASLTNSGQRHLAFAIGTGDQEQLRQVFRSVLAVFWLTGLVVLAVGLLVTPLVLAGLTIPDDRLAAAWVVFWMLLVNLAVQAATTPYRAYLSSHQMMPLVATVEFVQSALSLTNAWCLRYYTGDKLIIYATVEAIMILLTAAYLIAATLRRVPGARCLPRKVRRGDLVEVGAFAFWSFLGNMASTLRSQGAVILVNVVFGPVANAAIALAVRAHGFLYRAAQSLNISLAPAIATHAGQQNTGAVLRLMNLGCKLPFVAASVLFAPFVLETDYLLQLWQARPVPDETSLHTQWLCGMALAGVMTWGHHLVLEAQNRLGRLTIWLLVSIAASLLLAFVGCKYLAWPAWSVSMIMCLSTMFVSWWLRPWIVAQVLDVRLRQVLMTSVVPMIAAIVPAMALAVATHLALPEGAMRLAAVTLVFMVVMAPLVWFVTFDGSERVAFADIFRRGYSKLVRR